MGCGCRFPEEGVISLVDAVFGVVYTPDTTWMRYGTWVCCAWLGAIDLRTSDLAHQRLFALKDTLPAASLARFAARSPSHSAPGVDPHRRRLHQPRPLFRHGRYEQRVERPLVRVPSRCRCLRCCLLGVGDVSCCSRPSDNRVLPTLAGPQAHFVLWL